MGLTSEPDWLAGLIAMEPFGTVKERNFKLLMGEAGDVSLGGARYPKLQMGTVPRILEGKRFRTPWSSWSKA